MAGRLAGAALILVAAAVLSGLVALLVMKGGLVLVRWAVFEDGKPRRADLGT